MTKYRINKRDSLLYKDTLKMDKLISSYKEKSKDTDFSIIYELVYTHIEIIDCLCNVHYLCSNDIHYFNTYFKNHTTNDKELFINEKALREFLIDNRKNVPKKFINDFFRCNGMEIEPEVDEGYTDTSIDNDLCSKYMKDSDFYNIDKKCKPRKKQLSYMI